MSPRNECFISEELRSGELRWGDRKMAVCQSDTKSRLMRIDSIEVQKGEISCQPSD